MNRRHPVAPAASATAAETPVLEIAVGRYPHTAALRSGEIASDRLTLRFADVAPINRAFAPMVREGRFDVCEMAIATFLQAVAHGKPLVLLPIVLAARFQEGALLCRRDSELAGPADLAGKRIGVRAYSQTTGMWLRGTLQEAHGHRPEEIRWITFEGAHVAEVQDPPWAERAGPGADMMAMLRAGDLDAVIVGNDLPADPGLRTVFADPAAAGEAFRRRHGFVPANHLLTMRRDLAADRPELAAELVRMVAAAASLAPPRTFEVAPPHSALAPVIALALRFSADQGLLPRAISADEVLGGATAGTDPATSEP